MKHFASPAFWALYNSLPEAVRRLADKKFTLLKANPQHPSLHLKRIGRFWSVRVGRRYRAIAVRSADGPVWFWIGTHAEYDDMLKS